MKRKLILPTEVKVCATCSYWDGERKIDAEYGLVVVSDCCEGECLVQEKQFHGLDGVHRLREDCSWERLECSDAEQDGGDESSSIPVGTESDAPEGSSAKPDAAR